MSRRKLMQILMIIVAVAGALTIGDIWFDIFTAAILRKALVTCVVLAAVVGLILAIRGDMEDEDKKKKDGYYN